MFATLEKIAQSDPKTADIVLIENYAAFQNRLCFFLHLSLTWACPMFEHMIFHL
jgi:hypothetical protein